MASFIKNIIVFGGLALLAAAGWWLFVDQKDSTLSRAGDVDDATLQTQLFVQRLTQLQQMELSSEIFNDARFLSLEDFASVSLPVPGGRPLPFLTSTTTTIFESTEE